MNMIKKLEHLEREHKDAIFFAIYDNYGDEISDSEDMMTCRMIFNGFPLQKCSGAAKNLKSYIIQNNPKPSFFDYIQELAGDKRY